MSPELGNFYYELLLVAEKSPAIPTLNYKASLGTS